MVDAYNATPAEFDAAAQRHANAFWFWLVIAGLTWWFASLGWAVIPALFAGWAAVKSVGATRAADKLRNGSYELANPNNGSDKKPVRRSGLGPRVTRKRSQSPERDDLQNQINDFFRGDKPRGD